MRVKKKLLSVIVPAYKQAKTIKRDLKNIEETLSEGLRDINFEIICVVDGMLDKTFQEAKKIKSKRIKVYDYENNKG